MTVFQLISVVRDEQPGGRGVDSLSVQRRKLAIDPETGTILELLHQSKELKSKTQIIPFPNASPVTLEIVLGKEDILSITCNEIQLNQLVTPETDLWFGLADYQGPCGLFTHGDFGTKFSSVAITPFVALEKE